SDLASNVQRGILHQSPGQREAFRPLAPFAASVKSAAEAAGTTGLAIAHATGRLGGHVSSIQRPGPVYVEVPFDVLDRDADDGPDADHRIPAMWSAREPVTYDDAVEALGVATAPVVWAGGGVVASGAFEALARVAERFAAPVVTTYLGRTAIPASHPLAVAISPHEPAVRKLLAEADVLLAVGTDFGATVTMGGALRLPERIVRIDVDPEELAKTPAAVRIRADAREALAGLDDALARAGVDRSSHLPDVAARIAALRQEVRRGIAEDPHTA